MTLRMEVTGPEMKISNGKYQIIERQTNNMGSAVTEFSSNEILSDPTLSNQIERQVFKSLKLLFFDSLRIRKYSLYAP